MQQKYKGLSFAIVAALYIFLVPSPSQANNYTVTHTPGETVGANAWISWRSFGSAVDTGLRTWGVVHRGAITVFAREG